MNVRDYKTLSIVKSMLVRQWIDTSKCEFTCTNGVLYFTGVLHMHLGTRNSKSSDEYRRELLIVIKRLERTLRQVPEVRDVIFRLDNLVKSGTKWSLAKG